MLVQSNVARVRAETLSPFHFISFNLPASFVEIPLLSHTFQAHIFSHQSVFYLFEEHLYIIPSYLAPKIAHIHLGCLMLCGPRLPKITPSMNKQRAFVVLHT